MSEPQAWHRLFGLSRVDFFRGTSVQVELEKDLSLKQQLLDVVLIRTGGAEIPRRMPDGMEDLTAHNLISFKSYQEPLEAWTLQELIGHYVNYRKQTSPSMQDLLSEEDFRLFAVCVRFPRKLAGDLTLNRIQEGVYEADGLTKPIRVLVVHELPRQGHNAMLHLFSAQADLLRYGTEHHRIYSEETSTFLYQLFQRYQLEAAMSETLEEFLNKSMDDILKELPLEKRLQGIPKEKLVEQLSVDDLLAALSPEARQALVRKLSENGSGSEKPEGA